MTKTENANAEMQAIVKAKASEYPPDYLVQFLPSFQHDGVVSVGYLPKGADKFDMPQGAVVLKNSDFDRKDFGAWFAAKIDGAFDILNAHLAAEGIKASK